jgi:exopolysaccharide biosynthesis polyprenyl glycosylphosphotransferase
MAFSVGAAGFLAIFIFYILPHWKYGRGIFLIQMVFVLLFTIGWRLLFSLIHPVAFRRKKILILGAGRCGMATYRLIKSTNFPLEVVGFLDDDPAKQGQSIGSPSVNRSSSLLRRALEARLKGIDILEVPTLCEMLTGRIPIEDIHYGWLLYADGFNLLTKDHVQKIKRLIDFGLSLLLLIATIPILALTALAIWIECREAVLFKQERVGKGGKIFTIWKFRSMRQGAEQNGPVWAKQNDARLTRVGKLIRLFRIDELPQIWNIFLGEMSLIGPRPERPEFVRDLKSQIPYYDIRHSVRPGITGWAQINDGYGDSTDDARRKLEYDIYYVKNMSLLLDLKIILGTISVVIFREGAR